MENKYFQPLLSGYGLSKDEINSVSDVLHKIKARGPLGRRCGAISGRVSSSVVRDINGLFKLHSDVDDSSKPVETKSWSFPDDFETAWSSYESLFEAAYRHFSSAIKIGVVLDFYEICFGLICCAKYVAKIDETRLGWVHLKVLHTRVFHITNKF